MVAKDLMGLAAEVGDSKVETYRFTGNGDLSTSAGPTRRSHQQSGSCSNYCARP